MRPLRDLAGTVFLAFLAPLLAAACAGDDRAPAPPAVDAATQAALTAQPSAEARAAVTARLAGFGFYKGSPDAPVTVVEFSDFGCPYCAKFGLETLPELEREYIETGRVRWQYVPFELGIFPNGGAAARASLCAAEQEAFWPMHDLLYARQAEWKPSESAAALFVGYARSLGLSPERFETCYRDNRHAGQLERHNRIASDLGVRATPSFLVGGRPVEGALPIDQFRMLLEWAGAGAPAR